MRVLGIDVWKGRWVGVVLDDGRFEQAIVDPALDALIDAAGAVRTIGIDIPLGTVEGGRRRADGEARTFAKGFGSSVFAAPPRDIAKMDEYGVASQWCRQNIGRGISQQSFALRMRILEAEEQWVRDPARIFEVHPEVSFRAMALEYATADAHSSSKRTWNGFHQRRSLLRHGGIAIPDELGAAGAAALDDVLDAAAAAWSAQRIARSEHGTLPEVPERDRDHPLDVAIWY